MVECMPIGKKGKDMGNSHAVCEECGGKGCDECHAGWECTGEGCNKCAMGWPLGKREDD